MDCRLAVSLMHEYLDDDLSKDQAIVLKGHLEQCPNCSKLFHELEQTDMMLYAAQHHSFAAPDELTNRILNSLPKPKKQQVWLTWIKQHPAVTAAAVFMLIMVFSSISIWNSDNQLVVKGASLDQVVIEGDTVIVPEGKTVAGDLTVENGKTKVYGEVQGNVTVIDGSLYQASTAHISGQVKSINQAMDWLWYKLTNMFTEVAYY
ncbi:zf-HC2 domain-containing protein [Paenibacillus sediminis]|uniref:Anti-sigma-W factor RsiW n=1 Tax=Paenibacillus sediminis TaxID=664909 RepID=A0ABS4H4Z8_9BACL|nr:zf-HC2 domain-containing protein [Paenibacillus sediminis]MBP1937327.1 anti-sigma factor RsiW [Paenibacillus sediminis]